MIRFIFVSMLLVSVYSFLRAGTGWINENLSFSNGIVCAAYIVFAGIVRISVIIPWFFLGIGINFFFPLKRGLILASLSVLTLISLIGLVYFHEDKSLEIEEDGFYIGYYFFLATSGMLAIGLLSYLGMTITITAAELQDMLMNVAKTL